MVLGSAHLPGDLFGRAPALSRQQARVDQPYLFQLRLRRRAASNITPVEQNGVLAGRVRNEKTLPLVGWLLGNY